MESTDLVIGKKIPTFDNIIDNLYLGDIEAAISDNIEKMDIIVDISNLKYEQKYGITYYHYHIDDNRDVDITQFFDDFVNIINNNKSKKILVHCANSVSRSVTLVLYYLMATGKNLKDSFNYLKSRRNQYTKPNIGFIKQLLKAEKKLYKTTSMRQIDFYK